MAQKPVMLKDYLEADFCSESFWWAPLPRAGAGTGTGTTVRALLETELGGGGADKGGWRLVRSRSKCALTRLSAAMKLLQFSTEDGGGGFSRLLARSFSKKLRRSFWKKRDYGKEEVPISLATQDEFFGGTGKESRRKSAGNLEAEEVCNKVGMNCPFEEEKEQLSPVSVMDFPYQDEDEDDAVVEQQQPSANSPSFDRKILYIERAKNQVLQKIRRFESLADLDPVHLEHRFACTDVHIATTVHVLTGDEKDEDGRRRLTAAGLLRQLTGDNRSLPAYGRQLLFDFFVEETKSGCRGNEDLLHLATGWIAGGGGQVSVSETEMCGGDWMRFEEDEEILAVEMTGCLVTWLTEELVDDLLVSVV